ncbi:MAG TPA: hypothetical protein VGA62_05560 [Acidimicrobiia bacterium]
MDGKMKQLVATVALAGAITAGSAGVAFAADGSGGGSNASSGGPSAQTAKRHPAVRLAVRRGVIETVLATVGGTRADLRAALQSGKTISDYATAQGKDPQAVVTALVNAADAKVDELVANGTITQERGNTIKGKVPDRVNKIMTRQFGQHA